MHDLFCIQSVEVIHWEAHVPSLQHFISDCTQ